MLAATLPHVTAFRLRASRARPSATATSSTAWFTFETAVARGIGHLRLKDGKGYTLLTTITELKGHEEKRGATREKGIVHGAIRNRTTWLEEKTRRTAALGDTEQPYCVIIGGGQGGIALGARLKRLGVPTIIVEKNAAPRRLLAQPLPLARPARPGLVRPPALHPVPRPLAGVHAQGQDGRLAGDVCEGHGARLLGLHRVPQGHLRRSGEANGRSSSAATASELDAAAEAARLRHRLLRPAASRDDPRAGRLPRRAISLEPARQPQRPSRASAASSSAPTARRTTSAPTSGSTTPRR